MSSKEFPSCAYDVCAEFDCEETMALALIATRNELARTRKALDVAVDAIDEILYLDSGKFCKEPAEMWKIAKSAKDKITALEQKYNGGNK